jgi:hypothetical protein
MGFRSGDVVFVDPAEQVTIGDKSLFLSRRSIVAASVNWGTTEADDKSPLLYQLS